MLINISTATPPYKSPQAKILEELKNRMGNNAKAARLKTASILQRIMLNRFSREIAYSVASIYPTIIKSLIKRTRNNYHKNN